MIKSTLLLSLYTALVVATSTCHAIDVESLVDDFAKLPVGQRIEYQKEHAEEEVYGEGVVATVPRTSGTDETGNMLYRIATKFKSTRRGNKYNIIVTTNLSDDIKYFRQGQWVKLSGTLDRLVSGPRGISVQLKKER